MYLDCPNIEIPNFEALFAASEPTLSQYFTMRFDPALDTTGVCTDTHGTLCDSPFQMDLSDLSFFNAIFSEANYS